MKIVTAMAVACLSVGLAAGQDAQAVVRHYDLNIPKQSLNTALRDFAQQTGLRIALFSDTIDGNAVVGPILGTQSAEEALKEMLAPSGLSYKIVREGTIAVLNPKDMPPAVGGAKEEEKKKSFFDRFRISQADFSDFQEAANENAQAAAPSSEKEAEGKLEEIVVTAQKRTENLQDVPISISVLSGDDLDRYTGQGLTEALSRVPGVAVNESLQSGGTQLSVRGVTASDPLFGGASPIVYYLDSASFGFARSAIVPDPNVFDLERVEVLRGPQGTLYGAGGQGGVVRVLTNDANPGKWEFKARTSASATEDGGENYRGDAAVNIPLIDERLAVRAVVSANDLSGWIDAPNKKDVNDAELLSARVKVFARPTDNLTVRLSAWRSEDKYGAPSVSDDNDEINRVTREPIDTTLSLYNITLDYQFPLFSVSSATSYLDYSNDSIFGFGVGELPTDLSAEAFSQEILLNSTLDGPWQWTAGVFYRDAEDTLDQSLVFYPATVVPFPRLLDTSKSYAVFGEVSRSFLDNRLKMTAGLRYFSDDGATQGVNRFTETYDAVTPRLVLAWTPHADLSTYVSYAEGFRSGVYQSETVTSLAPQFPPAKPDTLHNYEIGAKGRLFGGALSYETAVYYIDWQDVQQILGVPLLDGSGLSVSAVVNGSSASGIGYDLALSLSPAQGLEVGGTFSWNNFEHDGDVFNQTTSGPVLIFASGDRLNMSPEYTVGAFAEYAFPIGGYEGRIEGSLNYTSSINTSELKNGPSVSDSITVGRVSFSIDSPSNWSGTLFVDNINDERTPRWLNAFDPTRSTRIRPRTVGVQLEYRY